MDYSVNFIFRGDFFTADVLLDFSEQPCYIFALIRDPRLSEAFGSELNIKTDGSKMIPGSKDYRELKELKLAVFEAIERLIQGLALFKYNFMPGACIVHAKTYWCDMKPVQQKTPYILWADDDEDDLVIMQEIIKSITTSFTVLVVRNGKEVLDHLALKEGPNFPCLIILDMNMPVLDGKLTLTMIKKNPAYRQIPVIIFTTSNSKVDKTFCELHGVEMITKPPTYGPLREIVQKFLNICS